MKPSTSAWFPPLPLDGQDAVALGALRERVADRRQEPAVAVQGDAPPPEAPTAGENEKDAAPDPRA